MKNYREIAIREFFEGQVAESHSFRVAVRPERISLQEEVVLKRIAVLMPAFVDGMGEIVARAMVNDEDRRKSPLYRSVRRVLKLESEFGKDKYLARESGRESTHHPILRADLVKNTVGRYMITEIEVDKVHGFGYASLGRLMEEEQAMGKGIVTKIGELAGGEPIGIVISTAEEFYEKELEFFARLSRKKGVQVTILPQSEIRVTSEGIYRGTSQEKIARLYNLPVLQGINRGQVSPAKELTAAILQLMDRGKVTILSGGYKGLSDKTFLGLVSNPQIDRNLEALLTSVFPKNVLLGIRKYLPRTEHLGFSQRHFHALRHIAAEPDQFFVKAVNGSGGRNMAFPGDRQRQIDLILAEPESIIIQRRIQATPHMRRYRETTGDSSGQDEFSSRYSLFAGNNGELLDLAITSSPGIIAHGGSESVLVPVVV